MEVIVAPYHLGRGDHGIARAPRLIAEAAGLDAHEVPEPTGNWELARVFSVNAGVAEAVRRAADRPALVLAGNCLTAVGVVAGLGGGGHDLGVVWFDAHGDLNTAESTASGFLDGTALTALAGGALRGLCDGLDGWAPVDPDRVVTVGMRALDPFEETELTTKPYQRVEASLDGFEAALDAIAAAGAQRVYVHVDLDVLDVAECRANAWSCPGGLTLAGLQDALSTVRGRFTVAATTIASVDADADPSGRHIEAAAAVARAAAG